MWYIFEEILHKQDKQKGVEELPNIEEMSVSTHEEAEAILLELGKALGYDTYTADRGKQYQSRVPR